MLELASAAAREARLGANITAQEGDARQAAKLFPGQFFDLIVCHNVLEFVDDPDLPKLNSSCTDRGDGA